MAKLGDHRICGVCKGTATLRLLQPSAATLGWVDEHSLPYDVSPVLMWQCEDCDNRQPFEGELEE